MKNIKSFSALEISEQILLLYSENQITEFLKKFSWRKANFNESIDQRRKLEFQTQIALKSDDETLIQRAIFDIYFWGFGRKRPNNPNEVWIHAAVRLMKIFYRGDSTEEEKNAVLVENLSIKNIGIATVSKWVCFCNQSKYAIYDSRVSAALRPILDVGGKRLFPTIARRQIKGSKYPPGDLTTPEGMASKYLFFLSTLVFLGEKIGMTPSEIEMALFMLGDKSND